VCDVVTINAPLHPETEGLFNDALIAKMKRGAYLVNTARGKICDRDAVVRALKSGQLAGYAGDVWFPQPAPRDHPWRTMPFEAMTPHISGSSLSAQARYAAGVREILECWFERRPIRNEYLIVQDGKLAGAGAHSYKRGRCDSRLRGGARFKSPKERANRLTAEGEHRLWRERKNEEAIVTIAASVQDCLAREGVHYDLIAHQRTRDSNHSAQAAHISGDQLAKCVMLEDDKGYLMAVVPASHKVDLRCHASSAQSRARLATDRELVELFKDCEPGALRRWGSPTASTRFSTRACRRADIYLRRAITSHWFT